MVRDWVRPPRPTRDLETQTTYGPQARQRGLYTQWSMHRPRLGMIRALRGEDSLQRSRAVCEKPVFPRVADQK